MFLPGNSGKRVAFAAMLALGAATSATMIACSSDDSTATTDGGGAKDTSTGDTSTGPVADTGTGDTSTGSDAGSTLYSRLGGHKGISDAVAAIVTAETGDPDIVSFFAPNLNNPNHSPKVADIEECLVDLLGQIAGGPESYPTTLGSGYVCRGMKEAHANLHIGNGTFDNFVAIAATELKKLGVADSDIATIGGALNGTKSDIVDKAAPDGGPFLGDAEVQDAKGGG